MAESNTFRCIVVTPERLVTEVDCQSVVLPAHDGMLGVQPGHAPLVGTIGHGMLRLDTPAGTEYYHLDGGFLQVRDDVLTILSERAVGIDKIDADQLPEALERAMELPNITDQEHQRRQHDVEIIREQQALAAKR